MKTEQLEDDKWYRFSKTDYLLCCDCSLFHILKIKIIDGKIFMKWIRDDKATASYRRSKKVKQIIKKIAKKL